MRQLICANSACRGYRKNFRLNCKVFETQRLKAGNASFNYYCQKCGRDEAAAAKFCWITATVNIAP